MATMKKMIVYENRMVIVKETLADKAAGQKGRLSVQLWKDREQMQILPGAQELPPLMEGWHLLNKHYHRNTNLFDVGHSFLFGELFGDLAPTGLIVLDGQEKYDRGFDPESVVLATNAKRQKEGRITRPGFPHHTGATGFDPRFYQFVSDNSDRRVKSESQFLKGLLTLEVTALYKSDCAFSKAHLTTGG